MLLALVGVEAGLLALVDTERSLHDRSEPSETPSSLASCGTLLRPLFARPAAWRLLDALIGRVMVALAGFLVAGT